MQYSMLPRSLLRLLLSLSVLLLIIISTASAYSTPCTIQVCQDKNCCKRFTGKASDLVQTLRQLSSHDTLITIEATTCLSHCDQGPNVRINDQEVQNNVESATSAAAMLELNGDVIVVHPTLLAACNVMERAHKGMLIIIILLILFRCFISLLVPCLRTCALPDRCLFSRALFSRYTTNITWLHFIESPTRLFFYIEIGAT
jgi:hypothetical protein